MQRRMLSLLACVGLAASLSSSAQKKTAAPPVADSTGMCEDNRNDLAHDWPKGPVYVVIHREGSPKPWARNPALVAPGVVAGSLQGAQTVACVKEKLEERGRYSSGQLGQYDSNGDPGYQIEWDVMLVRAADHKIYSTVSVGDFGGTDPPDERSGPGPGYGKPPVQPFLEWLRALLNQKVARYKSPLHWLDHPGGCQYSDSCEITSMAFAPDGSKLAVTIKSKLDSSVGYAAAFDLSSMKPLGMLSLKGPATLVAINSAGSLLATNGNGKQVEVWDVATQRMVHALPAASARSLMFAPTGQLGVAGKVESTVWDLGSEKAVLTAAGSRIALSPSGSWLVAAASAGAIAVSEMGTGRALGSFAGIGRFYAGTVLSGDGRVLAYANLGGGSGKLFTAGAANPEDIEVTDHDPHGSVNAGLRAMAGTPDGIVFAGAGVVGVSTYAHPKPQFFATGDDYVNAIAVSPDGGLLVTGDTWLNFQLWELEEGSPQPR